MDMIIRGQVQKHYSTELFTFRKKNVYRPEQEILAGCTGDTPSCAAYGSVQAHLTRSPNMVRSTFIVFKQGKQIVWLKSDMAIVKRHGEATATDVCCLRASPTV
jgi:hypothetical protein